MRAELPHNVVVVLSVNSGAVLHASCDPCQASSLGHCSHVVAVLFCILGHVQKHGTMLKHLAQVKNDFGIKEEKQKSQNSK